MNDSAKSVLCEEKIEKNLSDERLENAVSSTEFEVAAQRFRQLAKEEGIETAAGLWICRPLKQWIKNLNKTQSLQNASPHLDRNSLLYLAVGMNNSLHIRDCLLVSAVSDCDFDSLMKIASRPHFEETVKLVEGCLRKAFHDSSAHPDKRKCERASEMFKQIIRSIPEQYSAQPYAVLSYLMWWIGEPEQKNRYWKQALARDRNCTLALIVAEAIANKIEPAWNCEQ